VPEGKKLDLMTPICAENRAGRAFHATLQKKKWSAEGRSPEQAKTNRQLRWKEKNAVELRKKKRKTSLARPSPQSTVNDERGKVHSFYCKKKRAACGENGCAVSAPLRLKAQKDLRRN